MKGIEAMKGMKSEAIAHYRYNPFNLSYLFRRFKPPIFFPETQRLWGETSLVVVFLAKKP